LAARSPVSGSPESHRHRAGGKPVGGAWSFFFLPRLRRPQWGQAGPDRDERPVVLFSFPRLRRPQCGQAGPDREVHPSILFLVPGWVALSAGRLGLTGTSDRLFFFLSRG